MKYTAVLSSSAHLINLEKSSRDENNLCVVSRTSRRCVVVRGFMYAQVSFKWLADTVWVSTHIDMTMHNIIIISIPVANAGYQVSQTKVHIEY